MVSFINITSQRNIAAYMNTECCKMLETEVQFQHNDYPSVPAGVAQYVIVFGSDSNVWVQVENVNVHCQKSAINIIIYPLLFQ